MKTLTLKQAAAFDGTLIDVRLEDDFEAGHLPDAVNNCVFEVAFAERMAIIAGKNDKICVYGAAESSAEGAMAAEKLERAGYGDVSLFAGGVAAWQQAGRELAGDGDAPVSPNVVDARHGIDLDESRVLWVGRNLLNRHWGTVAISDGWFETSDGVLSGGEFAIDLKRIECSDLDENSGRDMLIAHLQSDDFFDTGTYPEAKFKILSSRLIDGATNGAPNLHVEGELTMKGVTGALAFDAVAGLTPDGKPAAQATLAFDRTLWKLIYGSGKWFHRLGGHLVNDLIELQIKIVAA